MPRRATSSVVGVVLLLAVAAALAGAVWAAVAGVAPGDPAPQVALSLSVSAADDRITVAHRGGDALDVRELRLVVAVDGTALARQPPVPFFAAAGFESGPTGPFNVASDPHWTAGERASFALAGTNAPAIEPGASVTVRVYAGDRRVAALEATAE